MTSYDVSHDKKTKNQDHPKSKKFKKNGGSQPSPSTPKNKNKKRKISSTEITTQDDGGIGANKPVAAAPGGNANSSPPLEKWSKSKKKRMRKLMAKQQFKNEQVVPSSGKVLEHTTASSKRQQQLSSSASLVSSTTNITATNNENQTAQLSAASSLPASSLPASSSAASKTQTTYKARLAGSRFRILNEELYTTTSHESYTKFAHNPELFEQYHEGFRYQVESWPENPVDVMVHKLYEQATTTTTELKTTNTISKKKNKTKYPPPVVVADFGCGDAQLAKDLLAYTYDDDDDSDSSEEEDSATKPTTTNTTNHQMFDVHSFDLVAPNPYVTACDMAKVPLPNKSVDVCVFCLSLMGTNLADFIREAHRVLKDDTGRIHIAEVRSRIEYSHSNSNSTPTSSSTLSAAATASSKPPPNNRSNNNNKKNKKKNKNEGTLAEFTDVLMKLGFDCIKTDRSNTMFLLLELKKNGKKPKKDLKFSAKPCIYKRR